MTSRGHIIPFEGSYSLFVCFNHSPVLLHHLLQPPRGTASFPNQLQASRYQVMRPVSVKMGASPMATTSVRMPIPPQRSATGSFCRLHGASSTGQWSCNSRRMLPCDFLIPVLEGSTYVPALNSGFSAFFGKVVLCAVGTCPRSWSELPSPVLMLCQSVWRGHMLRNTAGSWDVILAFTMKHPRRRKKDRL